MPILTARQEYWPLADAFVISRGAKTQANVVVVELRDGGGVGRGEAVPYARYRESVESVLDQIESLRDALASDLGRAALQDALPPGAARNALDCALWDLDAKTAGRRVWELAGLAPIEPVETCYTLSLGSADAMAHAARAVADRPMLKLKIGGADDLERVAAIRDAAPRARMVLDANEALSFEDLQRLAPDFARFGVELIEQPLAADADEVLEGYASPVPLCADESLHTRAELAVCAKRYTFVNIKLDKTGGLTEALALKAQARELGIGVMAGCMVATSLAMAPALLIAQGADFVDLDGPLLLSKDRSPGLSIVGSTIHPPSRDLWG